MRVCTTIMQLTSIMHAADAVVARNMVIKSNHNYGLMAAMHCIQYLLTYH